MFFPKIDDNILKLFDTYDKFVIIGHENPDGDCISSSIGVSELLKKLNKKYVLLNAGPFTKEKDLEYLFKKEPNDNEKKDALLIVVDCSTSARLGSCYKYVKDMPTLIIDHHESGDKSFGDYKYILGDSPSTTLLVLQFFKALNVEISEEAAKALFFGFSTDTGFFRFLNKEQSHVLNDVYLLVEKGAVISDTYDKMFNQNNKEQKLYVASLIKKAQFINDDKLVIVRDSKYLLNKYKSANRDSDALFDQLLSIKSVQAIILCKYINGKENVFSLRSKNNSNIDVGKIAQSFNGGGHFHAAGFKLKGTEKQNIEIVKSKFKEYL